MFRNKIAQYTIGTLCAGYGIFKAGDIHARDEANRYQDFKKQYPGEEPDRVFHNIGSYGGYTTYERNQKNHERTTPTPK